MFPRYHRQVTHAALNAFFGEVELEEVISANLAQDHISGQIGHPEFHFDDSEFLRTYAYLANLKSNILDGIGSGSKLADSRANFGRFTHAIQDFYAHSNYIRLWAQKHQVTPENWNGDIEFMDKAIINDSQLISGHFYSPWELITFIPFFGRCLIPLFPRDSHAVLNIDSPDKSDWFPLAFKAAELRTRYEAGNMFTQIYEDIPQNLFKFLGKSINPFKGV